MHAYVQAQNAKCKPVSYDYKKNNKPVGKAMFATMHSLRFVM